MINALFSFFSKKKKFWSYSHLLPFSLERKTVYLTGVGSLKSELFDGCVIPHAAFSQENVVWAYLNETSTLQRWRHHKNTRDRPTNASLSDDVSKTSVPPPWVLRSRHSMLDDPWPGGWRQRERAETKTINIIFAGAWSYGRKQILRVQLAREGHPVYPASRVNVFVTRRLLQAVAEYTFICIQPRCVWLISE